MNRSLHLTHYFRIAKVYGHTPIGVRAMVRLDRAFDRRTILERVLPTIEHLGPFQNVNGERVKRRPSISAYERERREIDARIERGERFDMFTRRQA